MSTTDKQQRMRVARNERRRVRADARVRRWRNRARIGKIMPHESFKRLARELLQDHGKEYLMSKAAARALQAATEDYLDRLFSRSEAVVRYARTETLGIREMQLAYYMERNMGTAAAAPIDHNNGYVVVQAPEATSVSA